MLLLKLGYNVCATEERLAYKTVRGWQRSLPLQAAVYETIVLTTKAIVFPTSLSFCMITDHMLICLHARIITGNKQDQPQTEVEKERSGKKLDR